MPAFTYTSRDQKGIVQTGQLDAVNEDQVVAILQHRGLLVTSISQKDLEPQLLSKKFRIARRRLHRGVTTEDQVLLCEQLATLIGAGVPILKSLAVVSAQVESQQLLDALEDVQRDVEAGKMFHQGLAKHPAVFSKLWLNLVETGEASGHLADSLQHLAKHFDASQRLQNAAKTALTYPVFLIVMAVIVVGVFVYWLIPKFTGIFITMHVELPLLTRIVIAVSDGARRYFVVMCFGIATIGFALRRYLRTESGRWVVDRLVLQLPVIRDIVAYVQLAQCFRGLSTLFESGVPLLSSLDILSNSATNKVYGQALGQLREAVKEGKSMTEPMGQMEIFPPMTVQMVQVGEEVGELAKMTGRVATHYEQRVEVLLGRMTRLFEPIAIVVMGILVLIIVLAIFMPLFKMTGGVIT